ncbi:MAG TPA: hypothetical protein VM847_19395, partial [Tahibacter sp.]|nr:hypothetical protein [Tahibacter sp.]
LRRFDAAAAYALPGRNVIAVRRLRETLSAASAMLLRFGAATPRDGQWENSYRALQLQVRDVLALLAAGSGDAA